MKADIILKSNAVFTGLEDKPVPAAVVISDNRITDVVAPEKAGEYTGENTVVYDYEDKLVMPGFVDGHDHMWIGAVNESRHVVCLQDTTSEADAIDVIKKFAADNPDEKRVVGEGWFPVNWDDAPLPTRKTLDEAVPDRPAYMSCADGHTCWMNTLALEEAGYTKGMELPGGSLGYFEDGELDGLAFEPAAMARAWEQMFDFPDDQIEEIIGDLMEGLAEHGVTMVGEMNADGYTDLYHKRYTLLKKMADEGKLTSRVNVYTALDENTDFVTEKKWMNEFSGDIFRISGFKMFLDGVTSTYSGLLLEPYTDKPETCGEDVPLKTQEELNKAVTAANREGYPVRIHCLAEGAVRMALDAFEASVRANGKHGLSNTIEHIETMHPDDFSRFAELGVIASMQTEHMLLDSEEKITRLGEERCKYEWPLRSLLDAGATLALGTDFPVVKYNQIRDIWASVNRTYDDGTPAGADNGQHITLTEALKANTLGSAKAYGRDNEVGTLEPGKLADVIVLDRNLFDIPSQEIKDAEVILTVMDGKVVFNKLK